jgi:hypothetical protein
MLVHGLGIHLVYGGICMRHILWCLVEARHLVHSLCLVHGTWFWYMIDTYG